ncbi:YdeI/OmpD-associated family protein [Caulobacter sp. CCUG 60055]|uniref:YdeI/OmpD-associated family protein n=1 Tax=Caulobacter sp. CCUG 60055 TaxID=2100090 RepID=UPI001FA73E99|nr:YdeI/OmpD-associated family protein [Caulobacter sp. CCUG 60055]
MGDRVSMKDGQPILAFADLAAWLDWLAAAPRDAGGVWLKFAKKGAPMVTLSKPEAVEGALRHGWIDGRLEKFDEHCWLVRFTPRAARSKWSRINREAAEALIAAGLMAPAGLAEAAAAQADGRWEAAYQSQATAVAPADLQAALDASPRAQAMFDRLSRANRYAILHRVHDAKKPQTRAARIAKFVDMLERGETIHPQKGGAA